MLQHRLCPSDRIVAGRALFIGRESVPLRDKVFSLPNDDAGHCPCGDRSVSHMFRLIGEETDSLSGKRNMCVSPRLEGCFSSSKREERLHLCGEENVYSFFIRMGQSSSLCRVGKVFFCRERNRTAFYIENGR